VDEVEEEELEPEDEDALDPALDRLDEMFFIEARLLRIDPWLSSDASVLSMLAN
jgi:hypothetical protein